jgi:hypothetical protein
MMKINLPEHNHIMKDLESKGFCIIKNCVSNEFISSQRSRWIPKFIKKNVDKKFVRGNLILGEKNFLSYSEINAWCMYRNFEFLWNKTDDEEAMKLHLEIHKFRNKIQGFDPNFGLNYNDTNYGIYISTSYYPLNIGKLLAHADGHKDVPIIHYMLPFTFKGKDYHEGGLFIEDTSGEIVDLDSLVEPGDVIFFDGRRRHWVDIPKSRESNSLGRLAVFAIPTHFVPDSAYQEFKRSITINIREFLSRIGLVKIG